MAVPMHVLLLRSITLLTEGNFHYGGYEKNKKTKTKKNIYIYIHPPCTPTLPTAADGIKCSKCSDLLVKIFLN
jgi:hypothetical protein